MFNKTNESQIKEETYNYNNNTEENETLNCSDYTSDYKNLINIETQIDNESTHLKNKNITVEWLSKNLNFKEDTINKTFNFCETGGLNQIKNIEGFISVVGLYHKQAKKDPLPHFLETIQKIFTFARDIFYKLSMLALFTTFVGLGIASPILGSIGFNSLIPLIPISTLSLLIALISEGAHHWIVDKKITEQLQNKHPKELKIIEDFDEKIETIRGNLHTFYNYLIKAKAQLQMDSKSTINEEITICSNAIHDFEVHLSIQTLRRKWIHQGYQDEMVVRA